MGKEEPAFRKRINPKQIELLYILYRFRFATTDQVAAYQGKPNGTRVYPRLMTLVEQGYVGRNFEAEYRKKDQHASYYLLPKGISALKQRSDKTLDPKVLHNIYGDKDASEQFIAESLTIFEAYCRLKARYGDKLQFFTRSDLAAMNVRHFPKPLPAAYLRLQDGRVKQYFLDIHPSTKPFFKSSQRIKQYATHADSKVWEGTGEELPKILAISDTDTMQKRLQKRMAKEKHPQLNFLLTAGKALTRLAEDTRIWQPADKPDELEGLETA